MPLCMKYNIVQIANTGSLGEEHSKCRILHNSGIYAWLCLLYSVAYSHTPVTYDNPRRNSLTGFIAGDHGDHLNHFRVRS